MVRSNNVPSLYLPKVYKCYSKEYIKNIFENIFGSENIFCIKIIKVKKPVYQQVSTNILFEDFNKVYIYVKKWPDNLNDIKYQLLKYKKINYKYQTIFYKKANINKYWTIYLNTIPLIYNSKLINFNIPKVPPNSPSSF